jgi:hypothetical protein
VLAAATHDQARPRTTRLARRWHRPRRVGIEAGTYAAAARLPFEVLLDPLIERVEIGDRPGCRGTA